MPFFTLQVAEMSGGMNWQPGWYADLRPRNSVLNHARLARHFVAVPWHQRAPLLFSAARGRVVHRSMLDAAVCLEDSIHEYSGVSI